MPGTEFGIRRAIEADAPVIGRHRAAMFRDMGLVPDAAAAHALADATAAYLAPAIADGGYHGWLATSAAAAGHVVGGAGVQVRTIVPRPGPGGTVAVAPQALVINVYTEPDWRRRGIAEALMRAVLDWARGAGVSSVVLHASDAGRALYERLGFRATNEMTFHDAPLPAAHQTSNS